MSLGLLNILLSLMMLLGVVMALVLLRSWTVFHQSLVLSSLLVMYLDLCCANDLLTVALEFLYLSQSSLLLCPFCLVV